MGKKEKGTSNPCQQDPKAQQSKQGESCTTEKQVKKPFQPANPGQSGNSNNKCLFEGDRRGAGPLFISLQTGAHLMK